MSKFIHSPYCVVVADSTRAHYFSLRPTAHAGSATPAVVEHRADLVRNALPAPNATGDQGDIDLRRAASGGPGRNDDASDMNWQREHERQFATEVIETCADYCREWDAGAVVLVAEKHMLGLLRQRTDLLEDLEVLELCRDLVDLDDSIVHARLAAAGMVPGTPAMAAARHAH